MSSFVRGTLPAFGPHTALGWVCSLLRRTRARPAEFLEKTSDVPSKSTIGGWVSAAETDQVDVTALNEVNGTISRGIDPGPNFNPVETRLTPHCFRRHVEGIGLRQGGGVALQFQDGPCQCGTDGWRQGSELVGGIAPEVDLSQRYARAQSLSSARTDSNGVSLALRERISAIALRASSNSSRSAVQSSQSRKNWSQLCAPVFIS